MEKPEEKTYPCGHGWTFMVKPPVECPTCHPCMHGDKCSECKKEAN